ncbi:hypothetical protein ACFQ1M_14685 [Sungkyunkwania multivorans]|uniref:Adhesin domain-containing protein n=1 Tax=Sungkyunkwania multivorans TaxID=1173618 RepID=A0ABW3D052_9FLAO
MNMVFGNRYILIFLLFYSVASSQKRVEKVLNFEAAQIIEVNAENCFRLDVNTHAENKIVIEAAVAGEYQNDLLVSIKELENRLQIGADFQPMFKDPNDKLSAHKVVSISMKIWLPENRQLKIRGNYTNTKITGVYQDLQVQLNDGSCRLRQVAANVVVSTLDGDIHISQISGEVNATSRHGRIVQEKISSGNSQLLLKSINGNIYIKKSE